MENKQAKTLARILAYIFDDIICFVLASIFLLMPIISLVSASIEKTEVNVIALFFSSVLGGAGIIIVFILYFIALPTYWKGQTLGKRFFHIKIVTVNGDILLAKTIFIRELSRIFLFVLTFGLSSVTSLITLCITKKHICFHEVLSGTKVIETNLE